MVTVMDVYLQNFLNSELKAVHGVTMFSLNWKHENGKINQIHNKKIYMREEKTYDKCTSMGLCGRHDKS